MKKKLAGILTAGAIVLLGAHSASAATTLFYYSFGPVSGGSSTFYSTSTFSSTTGTVTVKGWQTANSYPNTSAHVYYSVVKKGFFYDSYYGNEADVPVQYTQAGTSYYAQITNVPNGSGYSVRIDPVSTDYTSGAGNGYE